MASKRESSLLKNYLEIYAAASRSDDGLRCMISPHPKLKKKLKRAIMKLKEAAKDSIFANNLRVGIHTRP